MTDFFFISSSLHLMMAANLSIQNASRESVAIIISKQPELSRRHTALAKRFPRIFDTVVELPSSGKRLNPFGPSARRRILRELFAVGTDVRIFTGNDRRMEFQYAMHLASRINPRVEGVYLDEGAVTYVGHKSMNSVQHRYMDPFFKKLFYGLWYKSAVTTGASAWIKTAYVAFPHAVHPLLKCKTIIAVDPAPFKTETFRGLALAMLEGHSDYGELLRGIKVMMALPHEGSYIRSPQRYEQISRALLARFRPTEVAVKPHPRITSADPVQRMFPGAVLLDHAVGMEALLPLLSENCVVVGDISSTLLTTRWMRPDLPVMAVMGRDSAAREIVDLYRGLNIPMVSPDELAETLEKVLPSSRNTAPSSRP